MLPTRPGEELEPGLRFSRSSTELGLRLTFLVKDEVEVHVEVNPIEDELKFAVRTKRLGLAYRTGGAEHVDQKLGLRVCEAVARAIQRREHEVLARLARDADASVQLEGTTRIREIRVSRILELAGTPDARFYTLSPYVGCLIGCRFCYAQSRLNPIRSLLHQPKLRWGSYVDVRVNAAEVLAEALRALPRRPIKFCPIVSDPYQAVEQRAQVTRRCIEVLRDAEDPPPSMVMTRSSLILRDFDLITETPRIWVGASIPTIDDEVRKHFEPRAASIPERLEMLRRFKRAGVKRCVIVQPMLPGNITALADGLAEVVESVSIGVLRGEQGAEEDFAEAEYSHCRDEAWQRDAALELKEALEGRGVSVWLSELPPEVAAWRPQGSP